MDLPFTFPFPQPSSFTSLLNSQQNQCLADEIELVSNCSSQSTRKDQIARKSWTPSDDVLLISSWLNTSKDPVIGNEQKCGAFWKRVAAYFAASCKDKSEIRSSSNCKQRWHKINDLVCKFSGAYDAASREKSSGQNENDVLKNAHQIFYNNHNKKFTLEHAWKELRNDQKWCELSTSKTDVSSKRRRTDEASQSPVAGPEAELSTNRPPGVKAAKGKGKREGEGRVVSEFKQMWDIKAKDHAMKMLQILISKKEPLSECEEDLKRKLIADMMD